MKCFTLTGLTGPRKGTGPAELILTMSQNEVVYTYDALPLNFTGKERDSESGLDNFGARYPHVKNIRLA